jgi:Protein of unknown function (DUF3634)
MLYFRWPFSGVAVDHILVPLLLFSAVAVAVWWAATQRSAFVVRLVDGSPRAVRGKVTSAFLGEIGDVCRRHAVASGTIRGVVRQGRIALSFSGSFPPGCRQQLRNVWSAQGWSVPVSAMRDP